jgi:hypothetical protein
MPPLGGACSHLGISGLISLHPVCIQLGLTHASSQPFIRQ